MTGNVCDRFGLPIFTFEGFLLFLLSSFHCFIQKQSYEVGERSLVGFRPFF